MRPLLKVKNISNFILLLICFIFGHTLYANEKTEKDDLSDIDFSIHNKIYEYEKKFFNPKSKSRTPKLLNKKLTKEKLNQILKSKLKTVYVPPGGRFFSLKGKKTYTNSFPLKINVYYQDHQTGFLYVYSKSGPPQYQIPSNDIEDLNDFQNLHKVKTFNPISKKTIKNNKKMALSNYNIQFFTDLGVSSLSKFKELDYAQDYHGFYKSFGINTFFTYKRITKFGFSLLYQNTNFSDDERGFFTKKSYFIGPLVKIFIKEKTTYDIWLSLSTGHSISSSFKGSNESYRPQSLFFKIIPEILFKQGEGKNIILGFSYSKVNYQHSGGMHEDIYSLNIGYLWDLKNENN